MEFVTVIVNPPAAELAIKAGRSEIIGGPVIIRREEGDVLQL